MCNKADNSCRQEKLGCKGCFYNICNDEENKAIEILQAVGIKCDGIDVFETIKNFLCKIIKENTELKQITNSYDVICKNDADYILIANKSYFDNGIFKDNLIPKSKIIDLKKYYEEQAEETEKAYGKLRNIPNLYRIYR